MTTTCKELRGIVNNMKGKRELLIEQLDEVKLLHRKASIMSRKLEEAQTIIRTVAIQTQQQLQFHISAITTSALEAVFFDPYEFKLQFVERGGKTEADAVFFRNNEQIDPMTGSGGGAIDVAAFSLRVSAWKLAGTRSTLILDEPFRFLSRNLHSKAAEMLQEISKKLSLQIIMVTHSEELIENADKIFYVSKKKNYSRVKM